MHAGLGATFKQEKKQRIDEPVGMLCHSIFDREYPPLEGFSTPQVVSGPGGNLSLKLSSLVTGFGI